MANYACGVSILDVARLAFALRGILIALQEALFGAGVCEVCAVARVLSAIARRLRFQGVYMNTALSALRPYALTLAGNLVAYKQAGLGRRRVSAVLSLHYCGCRIHVALDEF